MTVLVYIPTSNVWEFQLFLILANTRFVGLFFPLLFIFLLRKNLEPLRCTCWVLQVFTFTCAAEIRTQNSFITQRNPPMSFCGQPQSCLVVQWLRLALPKQGLWVQSLVGELRCHMWQPKVKRKKPPKQLRPSLLSLATSFVSCPCASASSITPYRRAHGHPIKRLYTSTLRCVCWLYFYWKKKKLSL